MTTRKRYDGPKGRAQKTARERLTDLAQSAENLAAVARLASETLSTARRDLDATAQAAELLSLHLSDMASEFEAQANGGAS